jgi:hypothetical protein
MPGVFDTRCKKKMDGVMFRETLLDDDLIEHGELLTLHWSEAIEALKITLYRISGNPED